MATTGGPKMVTDGLVFNIDTANIKSYPGLGTTWTDITNNGYNGTLLNGPVFDSGSIGNLDFDGSNDYVTIAGNTTNNNHAWTADNSIGSDILCYEIWVKTPDNSGRIISKPWNGNGRYNISVEDGGFYLLVGNGGTYDDPDSSSTIAYSSTIDDDIWHQVVVWANSTNQGFYIDGGLDSGSKAHGLTGGVSNRGNTTQPLIMMSLYNYGEGWAGNTNFSVEGKVAIFRKYSRVLTASEVLQNYNATKTRFEY